MKSSTITSESFPTQKPLFQSQTRTAHIKHVQPKSYNKSESFRAIGTLLKRTNDHDSKKARHLIGSATWAKNTVRPSAIFILSENECSFSSLGRRKSSIAQNPRFIPAVTLRYINDAYLPTSRTQNLLVFRCVLCETRPRTTDGREKGEKCFFFAV